jgi:hypothetical protein
VNSGLRHAVGLTGDRRDGTEVPRAALAHPYSRTDGHIFQHCRYALCEWPVQSHLHRPPGAFFAPFLCSRRNADLCSLILAPSKAGHIIPKGEAIAPKGNIQNQDCRMR